jgi:hypothetical protein
MVTATIEGRSPVRIYRIGRGLPVLSSPVISSPSLPAHGESTLGSADVCGVSRLTELLGFRPHGGIPRHRDCPHLTVIARRLPRF